MSLPESRVQALDISIVVPLYNEEENVELLYQSLHNLLLQSEYRYEIIFVDDGSRDRTFAKLEQIVMANPCVQVIKFRSNFGQSAATDAGFELARGEMIIVMDGDLQNDPHDIPKLLAKMEEGYDLVSGWRKNRKDKYLIRKLPSFIANKLICSVTKVQLHDTGCALKVYRKDVVKNINLYGELHRFLPALAKIEGAKIAEVPVKHHIRRFGKSKYGLSRTFRVLMDLLSLSLFIKYLRRPLYFFGKICIFFLLLSLISGALLASQLAHTSDLAEANVLITIFFLFTAAAVQFLFLGLLASLIYNSGKKKKFYLSELIQN